MPDGEDDDGQEFEESPVSRSELVRARQGQKRLEALLEWKKSQRFFKVPLVPVSSSHQSTEVVENHRAHRCDDS